MQEYLLTDSHMKLIDIISPKSLRTELKCGIAPWIAAWSLGSTHTKHIRRAQETKLSLEPQPAKVGQDLGTKAKQGDCLLKKKI